MHTIIHFLEFVYLRRSEARKSITQMVDFSIGKVNSFKVTCLSILSEFAAKLQNKQIVYKSFDGIYSNTLILSDTKQKEVSAKIKTLRYIWKGCEAPGYLSKCN